MSVALLLSEGKAGESLPGPSLLASGILLVVLVFGDFCYVTSISAFIFTWCSSVCVSVSKSPLFCIKTQVILDQGPTLLQGDLTLTLSDCIYNDLSQSGHVLRWARTATQEFWRRHDSTSNREYSSPVTIVTPKSQWLETTRFYFFVKVQ